MEGFTTAVRTVCLVSAGIFLIESIAGGTNLKKQMEIILKLVLAVVIIEPFVGGNIEFDLSGIETGGSDISGYAEIYDNELARQTGENISNVLMTQLKAAGIAVEKIRTDVNISTDGSISINKVIVETEEPEAAARLIRNSLGQETEVINGKV